MNVEFEATVHQEFEILSLYLSNRELFLLLKEIFILNKLRRMKDVRLTLAIGY